MKLTATLWSLILFSQLANAGEAILLNLDVKNDMDVKVTGVYQAQKDSFFCKRTTTSDGEIRRVPKTQEIIVGQSSTAGKYNVEVIQELDDSCDNQLVGLALTVSNKALPFQQTFGVTPQKTDPVGTQKIVIGLKKDVSDPYYTSNAYDIKIGPSERASVSIEIVK